MNLKLSILTLTLLASSAVNASTGDLILDPDQISAQIGFIQNELATADLNCVNGTGKAFHPEAVNNIKKSNIHFVSNPDLIDKKTYTAGNLAFVKFGDGNSRQILHFIIDNNGRMRGFKFFATTYKELDVLTGHHMDPEVQTITAIEEEVYQICTRK